MCHSERSEESHDAQDRLREVISEGRLDCFIALLGMTPHNGKIIFMQGIDKVCYNHKVEVVYLPRLCYELN